MKIRPPLHVSLNNSVTRPLPVRLLKYDLVTELLRETCKGGLILSILEAYVPGNLNSNRLKFSYEDRELLKRYFYK